MTRPSVETAAGVTIRRARASDAARLAALSGELGYPVSVEDLADRLARLSARDADVIFVAATAAGEVIGWLHGAEQELLESGRRCEILGLVVGEGARGRGVGRSLVEAVEAWARSRRLGRMTVRSNVARSDSHPFYERLGYARSKTQHAYRKTLAV
jgi:GNAT superfamily N-acetyltransferase